MDSNLYLCGLCYERERVHWRILMSPSLEEQTLLSSVLQVLNRADETRPKKYGF